MWKLSPPQEGEEKWYECQGDPVPPASEALTYSKMSLTRLCSILMALCCAIRCSATAGGREQARWKRHMAGLPSATAKEAPPAFLTSGVLAAACGCHSGHVVDANAFSFLRGQSVGQFGKQHGGLQGTKAESEAGKARSRIRGWKGRALPLH